MTNASILVVGDDADAREMLRLALDADGYAVATAESARGALDTLRSSTVACVLLDLNVNGIDAASFRAVQRRDRALAWIPVIVLSAQPDGADAARQLGAAAYLRKPFDLDELHRTVEHALEAGAGRARH